MKTAIILHGRPTKEQYFRGDLPSLSNMHWLPWLQSELVMKKVLAQTPELPEPYTPRYQDWKRIFEQFDIDENTHLVGHSAGAGFLVRWLSETGLHVGKVVLVAPWLDPEGELDTGMYQFEIDHGLRERTQGLEVFMSRDDEAEVHRSVELLRAKLPDLSVREFDGYGHFTLKDMETEEFPELRDAVLEGRT